MRKIKVNHRGRKQDRIVILASKDKTLRNLDTNLHLRACVPLSQLVSLHSLLFLSQFKKKKNFRVAIVQKKKAKKEFKKENRKPTEMFFFFFFEFYLF